MINLVHESDPILKTEPSPWNFKNSLGIIRRLDIENDTCESVELLKKFGYKNFYEMRERGWLGQLSRRPKKLARTILTLTTGSRPSKATELGRLSKLEKRSYPMLICTTELDLTL